MPYQNQVGHRFGTPVEDVGKYMESKGVPVTTPAFEFPSDSGMNPGVDSGMDTDFDC